ncbi:hypothetical protein VAWG003_39930 [Aeromonas dhakensis]|nr:hypothetical protein VAWG003_39930 [Aeromonas dhakensis]
MPQSRVPESGSDSTLGHRAVALLLSGCLAQNNPTSEAARQGGSETGRQGDRETGRQGDRETGRQGDRETGRQGDRETGRQGSIAYHRTTASVGASLC